MRRMVRARGGELDLPTSLLWQGAIYALWIPVAFLVAAIIRRLGTGGRGLAALAALGALTPLIALASAAIDARFGAGGPLLEAALGRLPVVLLIFTAVVAVGLAAAQRSRAVEASARARALEALLAEARTAARASPTPPARLMVMTGSRRTPVDLAEVEWFASAGNYVVVHWSDREGLVRETLRALEARLDPAVFARSHRSTIVNLARVRDAQSLSDGSWRLTLHSGAELVASRTWRDDILARLGR